MTSMASKRFNYYYAWKNLPCRMKWYKKRCRIVHEFGRMNSVLIEFQDGERVVTSRNAIRELKKGQMIQERLF